MHFASYRVEYYGNTCASQHRLSFSGVMTVLLVSKCIMLMSHGNTHVHIRVIYTSNHGKQYLHVSGTYEMEMIFIVVNFDRYVQRLCCIRFLSRNGE